MKIIPILCLFIFLLSTNISGQSTLDDEINKMATMLTNQLHNKKKVNRVAVTDFTFQGKKNTRIGKYLADELNGGIMMNGARFSMVNREEVRKVLGNSQSNQKPVIDLKTISTKTHAAAVKEETETKYDQNEDIIDAGATVITQLFSLSSKKLKGTDVIIHGSIVDKGDVLQIHIEGARNNKKRDNVAFAKGEIIKTPDIIELLQGQVAPPEVPALSVFQGNTQLTTPMIGGQMVTPFKQNNLTFEVIGCQQTGQDLECKLNIVTSKSLDLWVYRYNTRIIDGNGGYEFHVTEIKLADASTTGKKVGKTLVADIPIEAIFRFRNVNRRILTIAKMQIICSGFVAQLDNIPVE